MWGDQSKSESGGGGGGFMDESYTTVSTGQPDRGEAKRSNNVIPMMIADLHRAGRFGKTVWGKNVSVVCVVAAVKEIQSQTTKIGYDLEDESGTIMAFKWLEAESLTPEGIETNMYVRVYGTLRDQGSGVYHIFIMKIKPVKKYAEVFCHLLEVATLGLKMKNPNNFLQGGGAVEMPTGNNEEEDDDVCHGLTNEQKVIYKIIKRNDSDNGIERGDLKSQVPANLKSKVDGFLEFLASEGHIYTTRNDDYFKAT